MLSNLRLSGASLVWIIGALLSGAARTVCAGINWPGSNMEEIDIECGCCEWKLTHHVFHPQEWNTSVIIWYQWPQGF